MVTAAKADWLPSTTWLGFTPQGKGPNAKAQCEATIQRQFGSGYVLERVTSNFGAPNPSFDSDPQVMKDRAAHARYADGLIHIHKLRFTSLPLIDVIGEAEVEWLQDAWAKPGDRNRWSVSFPIIERYEIIGAPKARDVFKENVYRRLFQTQSAGLRQLDDEARAQIADLEIQLLDAPNFWIAVAQQVQAAEMSELDPDLYRALDEDIAGALEGETDERRIKLTKRAAWMAGVFAAKRLKEGTLQCDHYGFDPSTNPELVWLKPRSCFDVHHKNPLAEGKRLTTIADLSLLCPTCYRIEHLRLKLGK